MAVNGEDMTHHSMKEATEALKRADNEFEMYVKYNPKAFAEVKSLATKSTPKVGVSEIVWPMQDTPLIVSVVPSPGTKRFAVFHGQIPLFVSVYRRYQRQRAPLLPLSSSVLWRPRAPQPYITLRSSVPCHLHLP